MASNTPKINPRGIRVSMPAGYILGRATPGNGPAELLSIPGLGKQLVSSGVVTGPANPAPQEWTAGAISALGTGLSISGTTLETAWREGEVTAFSSGLSIVGTTLTVTFPTQEWTAGTVGTLGAGLAINSGTITGDWQTTVVTSVGSGLTIVSGSLEATGGSSEWSAGTVTALGTGLALTGGAVTTWNPSDKDSHITLSNGNETATETGASTNTWYGVRGTTSKSSGKYVFEVTCSSVDGGNGFIWGLANSSWALSGNYLGSDGDAIGYQEGVGNVYFNGSTKISDTSWYYNASTYPTAMIAVDLTAQLVWFYSPSSGQWNGDVIGNQNPATGTGGVTFNVTGAVFPAFVLHNGSSADIATLNTVGSFVNAVPSGFVAWDAAGTTLTPNWEAGVVTTIGSNLSLSGGTLSASAPGTGTVTQVAVSGAGISASTSPIVATGTLTVEWNAGTVSALGPNLAINSGSLDVVGLTAGSNPAAGAIGELLFAQTSGAVSGTCTITNASPAVVTLSGHGMTGICAVQFTTTGGLPSGLSGAPTTYFATPINSSTFHLSTTIANAVAGIYVNTSSAGSGTQTAYTYGAAPSTTLADFCGLSLTAGVWEVHGGLSYVGSSGNATSLSAWVSTTSASISGPATSVQQMFGISTAVGPVLSGLILNVTVSGAQTVYLSGVQSGGTNWGATGSLFARRVG